MRFHLHFLENGKINVALTKDNDAVTGTPNNDAYKEITHGWITFLSSVAKVTADTVTTPQAESTATQRDIPDFK